MLWQILTLARQYDYPGISPAGTLKISRVIA
jgi:hypothetical protein